MIDAKRKETSLTLFFHIFSTSILVPSYNLISSSTSLNEEAGIDWLVEVSDLPLRFSLGFI